jgi:hypothetical protein
MPEAGDPLTTILPWFAVVAIVVAAGLAYRANRIGALVGVLFAAASFSRITAPLGPYAVRLEQPALGLLILIVGIREREFIRNAVARYRWLIAAGALYLAANVISSVLYAARPLDSLRIAGWLGLSMIGGLAIAALVARVPGAAHKLPTWVVGAASIQVAVGLAAVASEALFKTTWGVQAADVVLGKTYGLSWEANVLAINLAMALAFVIVPGASPRLTRIGRVAIGVWLGVGLGLASSRGGMLALLTSVVLVGVLVALTARSKASQLLRRYGSSALGPSVAVSLAVLLTIAGIEALAARGVGWVAISPSETPVPGQGSSGPIPTSPYTTGTPAGSGAPATPAPPTPTPTAVFVGTSDTVAVRLENIRLALGEVAGSPLVGLGTDSYQQRHIEPSCRCPAAIANVLVGALYDSGVSGLLGLSVLLLGVLYVAWKHGEWAYLAAFLVMVLGFQATDALRSASNWILMGSALGLASGSPALPDKGPSAR